MSEKIKYPHPILDRLSYHVVYDPNLHNALDYAAANGFNGIQIALEVPRFSPERYSAGNRQAIKQHAEKSGIRLALHGPDDVTSLFTTHPALVRGVQDYYRAVFRFAEDIGASLLTIHIGQPAGFGKHGDPPSEAIPFDDRPFYEAQLRKNLQWLCATCPSQVTLCIENYKLNEMACAVVDQFLKSHKLFLCWDLAKTFDKNLTIIKPMEAYFLERLEYIRQCHLHDIVPGFSSHQVIGSGDLDFFNYLQKLQHYPVMDYCIEVRPREMALESLGNLKQMLSTYHEHTRQWRNIGMRKPDEEIETINALERRIIKTGELDDNLRALRRSITHLECTHYLFFENILQIIKGIGKKRLADKIYGCMIVDEYRKVQVQNYMQCLQFWLDGNSETNGDSELCRKIIELLGSYNERKALIVKRLLKRLEFIQKWTLTINSSSANTPPADKFADLDDSQEPQVYDLKRTIASKFFDASEFEQHIYENRICHHKFFRHLEIILQNIGDEIWCKAKPGQSADGLNRSAKTRHYVDDLSKWLDDNHAEAAKADENISALLGKKDNQKEWLVLSLRKTLTEFMKNMYEIGVASSENPDNYES